MTRAAVFLDRDGVINRALPRDGKAFAPRRLAELRILPGVPQALAALRAAGFLNVVVTNQPDIGNRLIAPDVLDAIHRRLLDRLPIDAIEVCPHRQDEGCACRKPGTALLEGAAARLGIELGRSFMVGDRWSDVLAGRRAGCYTLFVDRGYRERRPESPDVVVGSLPAAARHILALARTPVPQTAA